MITLGPCSLPWNASFGNTCFTISIALLIVSFFSSEVIATASCSPPAGVLVDKMKRERLYFSKRDVESQNHSVNVAWIRACLYLLLIS